MPKVLRSVLAIVAGFVTMFVIVIVCTVVCLQTMHLKSGHPTPGYLVINVIYSLAAAFAGGWVAARAAGYNPVIHGIILGAIMLVQSALFLLHPAASQPFSYQVFLTILPPLVAVAGSATLRSKPA